MSSYGSSRVAEPILEKLQFLERNFLEIWDRDVCVSSKIEGSLDEVC